MNLVLGIAIGLAICVPILFIISDVIAAVDIALYFVSGTLILATTLIVAIYILRNRLFGTLTSRFNIKIEELSDALLTALSNDDLSERRRAAAQVFRQAESWIGLHMLRRATVGVFFGLAAMFIGLLGTSAIYRQNYLICIQNELISHSYLMSMYSEHRDKRPGISAFLLEKYDTFALFRELHRNDPEEEVDWVSFFTDTDGLELIEKIYSESNAKEFESLFPDSRSIFDDLSYMQNLYNTIWSSRGVDDFDLPERDVDRALLNLIEASHEISRLLSIQSPPAPLRPDLDCG